MKKLSLMNGMATNILDETGKRVARCDFDGDFNVPEAIANAQRIVACVNACDGIETEVLEGVGGDFLTHYTQQKDLELVIEQRDELLKVAKKIQEILHHPTKSVTALDMWELDDVIAKCK